MQILLANAKIMFDKAVGQLLTVAAERILKPWDSRRQGSGLGNALVRSLV